MTSGFQHEAHIPNPNKIEKKKKKKGILGPGVVYLHIQTPCTKLEITPTQLSWEHLFSSSWYLISFLERSNIPESSSTLSISSFSSGTFDIVVQEPTMISFFCVQPLSSKSQQLKYINSHFQSCRQNIVRKWDIQVRRVVVCTNFGTCKGNIDSVPVSKQRRWTVPWIFGGPYEGQQYAVLIPSLLCTLSHL